MMKIWRYIPISMNKSKKQNYNLYTTSRCIIENKCILCRHMQKHYCTNFEFNLRDIKHVSR